ncbi:MAG: hypothetical protein ACOVP5_07785 [Chitinophagales bacterium]
MRTEVEKTQHPAVQGSEGKLASQHFSSAEQGQYDSFNSDFVDWIP